MTPRDQPISAPAASPASRAARWPLAALAALAVLLLACPQGLALGEAQKDEEVIYYKRDDQGIFHFTNRRTSSQYKVYMVFRGIMRANPNMKKEEIISIARKYSRLFNLDERLIQAVIEVESGFQSKAVSPVGAEGLMQIMPDTQKHLGVEDSFNPDDNIRGGVKYLREMLDRFGRVDLALAAYNAGPSRVEQYKGIPPYEETQNYVRKVLALYKRMQTQ